MTANPYLDAIFQRKVDDMFPKSAPSTPTKPREEIVTTTSVPLLPIERDLQCMQDANRMTFSSAPPARETAVEHAPVDDDDPYYVPNYFDAFEIPESRNDDTDESPFKLEFDPPLTHYAELRGGLPIGYVWIPPSSPEPMQRTPTPEPEGK
jgi:hypothetical protein